MTPDSSIDRPIIRAFVEDFYARIRAHATLGPIFEERLAGHWDTHFDTLTDFWLTVIAGMPAYKGNPFGTHMQVVHEGVNRMKPEHFELWLAEFEASTAAMLPPDVAVVAVEKARRIADSLKQGLFFRPATATVKP